MSLIIDVSAKAFLPVYRPYIEDYSNRYNVYYGGRGSGKTIFVMQKLLLKGLKEKRTILLMRKTTASCKYSVWKELKEAGVNIKDKQAVKAYFEAKQAEAEEKAKLEAEEKARAEEEFKKNNPSQEELLKEIRDLLKAQSVKEETIEQ